MKHNCCSVLLLLIIFSIPVRAQNRIASKNIKKTFCYSFENASSASQVEKLKEDVAALKDVSEVRSEYDSAKSRGQIIVVVLEKQQVYEGDEEFDILALKRAILQRQLTPYILTEKDTTTEN